MFRGERDTIFAPASGVGKAAIAVIRVSGPRVAAVLAALAPGVEFAESAYACLKGADAAVIITEWDEFRALDLVRVKALLARPVLVDLRNIYPLETMKALGFRYVCVGRGYGGCGEQ